MNLFERPILRSRTADDILYLPARTFSEHGCPYRQVSGSHDEFSNFSQVPPGASANHRASETGEELEVIDHISIGASDIARARIFYDATLGALGYRCLSSDASALGYGHDGVDYWVLQSRDPVPANPDSGLHFCFAAPDRDSVHRFHDAALKHGGTDNGSPGVREAYGTGYYASFVLDPDGYRLEAYFDATGQER
ncbi:MAG: VOC family protein [Pseudomonadales bacterium]